MTGVPEATQEHWSFGIHTDPEDVQTVYGYNVLYMADPSNHANQIREEVPIEEILHFKINVKRTVKRGLSDFAFSTHDAFTVAEKLRNNMAEGAAVQSALAYIRQHESATQAQIQNFLNSQQIDFTRANPLTGQQINYKQLEPGTIADIPRGMQYVQPPGAGNASGFIDILHATLRGAGCRWNAPEWLATGSGADMAAYTASLTAHAPFVRSATQKQNAYKKAFTQVLWEAIEYAIDYGRLPMETPHLIDIQCEAPSILARDEQDEAQANQIRVTGGWKSRQTVQQEEGLDPEQEMQNIEAYNERFGQGGSGAQGGKPGPVTVREYNFDPSQPRDRFGKWRKSVVASGLNLHPSSLHPPNNYLAYGYSSAALGDDTSPESPSLPPPGGVVDPAVIARCRREAERIAAEDEEHVARGKEPKNDFVREILATNPNISSDDLKRELFGMLLEEDARKRHAHRLKNDPAYVQGIKDVQASQRQAERQLAIQKMSGGERLVEALERSISSGNLSSEMREQVKEMIAALKDPRNQAILGSVLATVGIAQFTPAGPVVDSIVGILGYILVGKAVLDAAPDLARFVTKALEAKDDSDFDQAGQYFARGISPLLVQAGTTLVGMGVAKATSAGAKLVGKRIAALKVSKKPITNEGGKLRVDPKVVAEAEAEGATATAGNPPNAQPKGSSGATKPPAPPPPKPPTTPNPSVLALEEEKAAAKALAEMEAQAGSNSHFYSQHSAHTTLEEQFDRATTGMTPDGVAGKPVDSGRFLSHRDQLEAVKIAEDTFKRTGQTTFSFEMHNIVGEGFTKGSAELVRTSNVKAIFRHGKLITLYPQLSPLK